MPKILGNITATPFYITPTDEQVNAWLNAHPEATTTVQDGAITKLKLDNELKQIIDNIPSDPLNDGYYIIRRINDVNTYFLSEHILPSTPTNNGSYSLKIAVTNNGSEVFWCDDNMQLWEGGTY